MAVLVKMNVPGMTEKDYDDVSGKLTEPLRQAKGFQFHAGSVTKDGVSVTEVWETREGFDDWFSTSVQPNVKGISTPEITELQRTVSP